MGAQKMIDYDRLRSMIRRHEGVKKFPYKCSAGKTTIGIGHNLDDLGLSERIINEIFEEDISNTIGDCGALYPNWNELPDIIQLVLIDMMFNLGRNRMHKFKKMNAAINDHNWTRMAEEMKDSLWFSQVGIRATELHEMIRSVAS